MAPDGIVEPVDIAANSLVGLLAGVEDSPPDELGFQGLEERLDHGVVVAIPLAGHRDQDGVLVEFGLIVDRAILAAAVGMMDLLRKSGEFPMSYEELDDTAATVYEGI